MKMATTAAIDMVASLMEIIPSWITFCHKFSISSLFADDREDGALDKWTVRPFRGAQSTQIAKRGCPSRLSSICRPQIRKREIALNLSFDTSNEITFAAAPLPRAPDLYFPDRPLLDSNPFRVSLLLEQFQA